MADTIVPDFPLANKSFNQSYAGNDLCTSVTEWQTGVMDPVAALREIAYYKDRAREDPRRVMAYRKAADIVEALDDTARDRHGRAGSWQSLPGIGPKTAKVIAQAWAGQVPDATGRITQQCSRSRWRLHPRGAYAVTCTATPTGRTARPRSRR